MTLNLQGGLAMAQQRLDNDWFYWTNLSVGVAAGVSIIESHARKLWIGQTCRVEWSIPYQTCTPWSSVIRELGALWRHVGITLRSSKSFGTFCSFWRCSSRGGKQGFIITKYQKEREQELSVQQLVSGPVSGTRAQILGLKCVQKRIWCMQCLQVAI